MTSPVPVLPGRRIHFLDGTRGVAAMLVVLQHAVETQSHAYSEWAYRYVNLGRVGVVAFFLVSGYVIPLSLEAQNLRTFAIRRFFRLYPVYWVALGLFLVSAAGSTTFPTVTPAVLGLNLLMVQGLVNGPLLLAPSWTLGIELFFYGQQCAAVARRQLDRSVDLGWFWLAVFLLFAIAVRVTGHSAPLALPLLLLTASLGHALHLRDARGDTRWRGLLAATVVIVPIGCFLGVQGAIEDWRPGGYALSYLAGIALFWVFYASRRRTLPRSLLWLGGISYAIYLIHPAVAEGLRRAYGSQDWVLVVLNLILVPAAAVPLHRLVERPSIIAGRRLTRRAREPVDALPDPGGPEQVHVDPAPARVERS